MEQTKHSIRYSVIFFICLTLALFLFNESSSSLNGSLSVAKAGNGIAIGEPDTPIEYPLDSVISPMTAQSSPLINMDDFRADPRFSGIDGTGYTVVVLDTGIDLDHPFFGPDLDSNGVADRIVYHYDFADSDADATDVNGHGSNVSSIVGSSDGTHTGMAPGANLIHLKVFQNSGGGLFSYIEDALRWVVDNADTYNIVSVNMSLGDENNYTSLTSFPFHGLEDELAELAALGVVSVAAAGNDFYSFSSVEGLAYPAMDVNVLSVGAVFDSNVGGPTYGGGARAFSSAADRITPFSQRHSTLLDIMAPGANNVGAGPNGGQTSMAGTSQAAPHIAGIVALMQQLADQELNRRLTVAEVKSLLASTAVTIHDGDDEDDNVTNTNANYARVDMLALGEGILDLAPVSFEYEHFLPSIMSN